MAIKDSVISYLNLVINIEKLLNIHVIIFHVVSLTNITDYAKVESLTNEFKSSDSESITWLEIMMLCFKQHFVKTA